MSKPILSRESCRTFRRVVNAVLSLSILLFILTVSNVYAGESGSTKPADETTLKIVVAVVPFESDCRLDGGVCASFVMSQLALSEGITVVERSKIDKLIEEQRLSLSGFTAGNGDTSANVGELIGADYFVFGAVTGADDTFSIAMRVVDVKTGEAVLTDSDRTNLSGYTMSLMRMTYNIAYRLTGGLPSLGGETLIPAEIVDSLGTALENDPNALFDSSTFKVKVTLNRNGDTPVYKLDEKLSIEVKCERDAYLYIFNISKTGGVKVIFPNYLSRDNFIKAGDIVNFPPKQGTTFTWTLGAPAEGVEYIIAVATDVPVEFIDDFSNVILEQAFPSIYDNSDGFLTKQINVTLAETAHDFGVGFARYFLVE